MFSMLCANLQTKGYTKIEAVEGNQEIQTTFDTVMEVM